MHRSATIVATLLTALTFSACTDNPGEANHPKTSQPSPVAEASEPSESGSPEDVENLPDTELQIDGPRAAEALEHLLTT